MSTCRSCTECAPSEDLRIFQSLLRLLQILWPSDYRLPQESEGGEGEGGVKESEKGRKPKRESAAVASNSLSWVADSNDESSSDDEPVRAKVTRVSGGGREREHVFIAAHLTKESHDDVNINSGTSRHLCPNLSWFKPSTFRALKNPIPISTANASTILATATAVDAVTLVNCHPAMAALGQCTYSSSYWG